jgi:signal transduction histidine kinase
LQVQDTGHGISKQDVSKIFDPFFTKRDVGKGSGLGLSISHSIIEQHGGRIEVESVPEKGSKFTVILPSKEH